MHALFGAPRILVHFLVLAMWFVKNRLLKPILNRLLSTDPTAIKLKLSCSYAISH